MVIADLLQLITALVVLVAVTSLAFIGRVEGSDAIAVFGIVLGYAFGVSHATRANRRDNGDR